MLSSSYGNCFHSSYIFDVLKILKFQTGALNKEPLSEKHVEAADKALAFLETFLENQPYVCGEDYTLADMCLSTTVLAIKIFFPFDPEKYPKIDGWMERMTDLPYFWDVNQIGHQNLSALLQRKLQEASE